MRFRSENIEIMDTENPPPLIAWLPLLFFRPKRFFPHFIARHHPAVTILLVLIWGTVSALERIDRQYQRGIIPETVLESWPVFIGYLAIAGAFAGGIYYAIGGWWYRLRARWSGAKNPDPYAVRRVYIYAKAVYILPVMCMYIYMTAQSSSPIKFMDMGSFLVGIGAISCFAWSIIVSYMGVRRTFAVRTLPATIWFLVLPGLFPLIGAAVLAFLWYSTSSIPPNTNDLRTADHYGVQYELPANWTVNDLISESWENGEGYTRIDTRQDAIVEILTYASDRSAIAEIDNSVQEISGYWDELLIPDPYHTLEDGWVATSFKVRDNTSEWYTVTICVHKLPDGMTVELRGTCLAKEYDDYKPGFEVVRQSIQTR
jgi:hypothetical protein